MRKNIYINLLNQIQEKCSECVFFLMHAYCIHKLKNQGPDETLLMHYFIKYKFLHVHKNFLIIQSQSSRFFFLKSLIHSWQTLGNNMLAFSMSIKYVLVSLHLNASKWIQNKVQYMFCKHLINIYYTIFCIKFVIRRFDCSIIYHVQVPNSSIELLSRILSW